MEIAFIAFIILCLGGVAFFYFKNKDNTDSSPEKTSQPDVVYDPLVKFQEELLEANLFIRKNCSNQRIVTISEEILDILNVVFPKVNEMNPFGDSTSIVKSMPTRYLLQKCIVPFTNLSSDLQSSEENIEKALSSLDTLHSEVEEIKTYSDNNDLQSLDTKSEFIKRKFS